jgi:hypothetical protein
MNKKKNRSLAGLTATAAAALTERDYGVRALGQRIAENGVEGGQLAAANRADPEIARAWIPGVEIFCPHHLSAATPRVIRRIRAA